MLMVNSKFLKVQQKGHKEGENIFDMPKKFLKKRKNISEIGNNPGSDLWVREDS